MGYSRMARSLKRNPDSITFVLQEVMRADS